MKLSQITPENLSTLNGSLPYGSRRHIAEKSGTTLRHVTRVLLGIYPPDIKVIEAAIDYWVKYDAEQKMLNKKIEIALSNGK